MDKFFEFTAHGFNQFMRYTAFTNFTIGHIIMIIIALIFLYLAIVKDYLHLRRHQEKLRTASARSDWFRNFNR